GRRAPSRRARTGARARRREAAARPHARTTRSSQGLFEADPALALRTRDPAFRFQDLEVAHHFRERQIEMVLAGMREDLRRQLGRRARAFGEQLEDARLTFLVEAQQPVDDLHVPREWLRMAR